ncbi:MAG TPA: nickel-type superoxide dismutase maturation protease [Dehalococcoidia bacterium]|nr:nickel-type superoxide dismutase maturation protease [Dehalococcoidia bacterium]
MRRAAVAFALTLWMLALIRVMRRLRAYEVFGSSMVPTLRHGDFVLADAKAYKGRAPRPGHVVVVDDPRDPERTIIKRVASIDLVAGVWLEGDNAEESTDSRAFGAVSVAAMRGRVLAKYWPLPLRLWRA